MLNYFLIDRRVLMPGALKNLMQRVQRGGRFAVAIYPGEQARCETINIIRKSGFNSLKIKHGNFLVLGALIVWLLMRGYL